MATTRPPHCLLLLLFGGMVFSLETIHVSPTFGNDVTGNGSIVAPFATLQRAQLFVQNLLRAGVTTDLTVQLAPNESFYNTSLVFTAADSPPRGLRVHWRGSHQTAVYGGERIRGWTVHNGHVWKASLPAHLIDSRGRALFHTLVQDDTAAVLARLPDFGSGYLPCNGGQSSFTCPDGVLPTDLDCEASGCSVFTRAGYSSDIRTVVGVNMSTHTVLFVGRNTDQSRGSFYLQGAVELLSEEGEWAVRNGTLFYWPYSRYGRACDPNEHVITAPVTQRVFSFEGASSSKRVRGIIIESLRIIGASMPANYTYACKGDGPGSSPFGADCAIAGGPDTPDQTNTSPLLASQGMVYMENASSITIQNCELKAGGVAGVWMQEANENHTIAGNWVQQFGGFGIYINGVGVGDRRYQSAMEADINIRHRVHNNLFIDGGRQIEYGSGVWLFQAGNVSITHNVIHRFPRDGVGFYGMLPFWTANPGGPVAPGMPLSDANSTTRTPWGQFVTWNGNLTQWDVLFNKNNYLGWNDISNCNRQGLDGGVVESWGASLNNTWEFNAVHDNEGYAGLSLMFADDFSPSLNVRSNVLFENNCPISAGANCAVFMMKSVDIHVHDNVVADQNYSRVFELSPYRMPAANMSVERNVLWNTTLRRDTGMPGAPSAYTASCIEPWVGALSPQNATLGELLSSGDGTSEQRSMKAQYGFTSSQLSSPVVRRADTNYASNMAYLLGHHCSDWDKHSIELTSRPFRPVGIPRPWHSRTVLDYQVPQDSKLVTQYGFSGSFDVSKVGLTSDFRLPTDLYRRRDAFNRIEAERYDRTSNLWTLEAQALGSGTGSHFQKDAPYTVPAHSWARYDGVDFGDGGARIQVVVYAQGLAGGATVKFQLESPDDSGRLLTFVKIAPSDSYTVINGTMGELVPPSGMSSVFMVFQPLVPGQQIGSLVDWFKFRF